LEQSFNWICSWQWILCEGWRWRVITAKLRGPN